MIEFDDDDPKTWQRQGILRQSGSKRSHRVAWHSTTLQKSLIGIALASAMFELSIDHSPTRQFSAGIVEPLVSAPYEEQWDRIETPTGTYNLLRPIRVTLKQEEEFWFHWCEELGIAGHGCTPIESMASFGEEFAATFDGLLQEEDNSLTADAIDLRDLLLSITESIG